MKKENFPHITVPLSKSMLQRLLYAKLLAGETLFNLDENLPDDVKVFVNVKNAYMQLKSGKENIIVNIGESGFWARVVISSFPLFGKRFTVTGEGSILQRDMSNLPRSLEPLGINVTLTDNKTLPAIVEGRLKHGNFEIDASFSSQHISGLMFAMPKLNRNSTLILKKPVSIPYIEMTEKIINSCRINLSFDKSTNTIHCIGNQKFSLPTLQPEYDWSAAAFFAVYGKLKNCIVIKNVDANSIQGDKEILHYINADYKKTPDGLQICPSEAIAVTIDLTHTPDLFPPLAVYGVFAEGKTFLQGIKRLAAKESNRAEALITEMKKIGINIYSQENSLVIEGGSKIKPATVSAHNDHRIAMALAMISKISGVPVEIPGKECVSKSYPGFFEELEKL